VEEEGGGAEVGVPVAVVAFGVEVAPAEADGVLGLDADVDWTPVAEVDVVALPRLLQLAALALESLVLAREGQGGSVFALIDLQHG
jgi:hypothetical protein